MKKCPFCSEEIQDNAIKCRHCKSWLDVRGRESGQSTKAKNTPGLWYLVTEEDAQGRRVSSTMVPQFTNTTPNSPTTAINPPESQPEPNTVEDKNAESVSGNEKVVGNRKDSLEFGILRFIRGFFGFLAGLQVLLLPEAFSIAMTGGMVANVFIRAIYLVVFGALFFGLRNLINRLYTKKHGTPHPALVNKWAL